MKEHLLKVGRNICCLKSISYCESRIFCIKPRRQALWLAQGKVYCVSFRYHLKYLLLGSGSIGEFHSIKCRVMHLEIKWESLLWTETSFGSNRWKKCVDIFILWLMHLFEEAKKKANMGLHYICWDILADVGKGQLHCTEHWQDSMRATMYSSGHPCLRKKFKPEQVQKRSIRMIKRMENLSYKMRGVLALFILAK